MRTRWQDAITVIWLGAQLAACAPAVSISPGAIEPKTGADGDLSGGNPAVEVRLHLSGRYIALIGPKAQHQPRYLETPDTNYSCLRSFIDRQTGETAHQLYVAGTYDGLRDWDRAHDNNGRSLKFLPISRFKIACNGRDDCSYAEEFAARIPASELTDNPRGFTVGFGDPAGHTQVIAVSARQIAAQLAAVSEQRRSLPGPTAAAAHQP